jgi:hypothetical protein
VIEVIVEQCSRITSPLSTVAIFSFGGAVGRVAEHATAFPYATHRTTLTSWRPGCPSRPPMPTGTSPGCGSFFAALQPHSRGVYVNFTNDDLVERTRLAYTELQWTRLTALKTAYDPTNLFRLNANIPPWPTAPLNE